jgi:ferredoxin-like protein FixX
MFNLHAFVAYCAAAPQQVRQNQLRSKQQAGNLHCAPCRVLCSAHATSALAVATTHTRLLQLEVDHV